MQFTINNFKAASAQSCRTVSPHVIISESMRQYTSGFISDTEIYELVNAPSSDGWAVNKEGFDIRNPSKGVYAMLHSSPVTMNSERCRLYYLLMQSKLLEINNAVCYLIETHSAIPKDEVWKITLDGKPYSHRRIRRISAREFCRQILAETVITGG